MNVVLAILIGVLYAGGIYLLMRRSVVKLILGLSLLGHASNLLIFTVGGLVRGAPPLIGAHEMVATGLVADPVPQALILTAIVISFGVLAFTMVLVHRMHRVVGTDDLDQLKGTDTQ